ncbi:MAG: phosphopantetheine-binding protein [Propionibacteriaceae bacterium]|jgi:acyl carrier protein|nr:phosphopantetheine-binding protein [Propionibacteriaceae bacterium]
MSASYDEIRIKAEARSALNARLRDILVEGLELPVTAQQIDNDQPLFGRGLELDSLDTLEIVSLIDDEWNVPVTDDKRYVFGSVNKLADFVEEVQTAEADAA